MLILLLLSFAVAGFTAGIAALAAAANRNTEQSTNTNVGEHTTAGYMAYLMRFALYDHRSIEL